MIPIRTAAVIDAPEVAVRRAVRRVDVWTRTVRALGGRARLISRAEGADLADSQVRTGDRMELSGVAGRRTVRAVVTVDGEDLPRLSGPGIEAAVRVTGTAAGTLLTVDCRILVRARGVSLAARRRSLEFGRLLIGITTLVAREPLVVMAGAVVRDGALLAARRSGGSGAGQWELPGGKVEDGETEQQALARELLEEVGVRVTVGPRLGGDVGLPDGMVLRTRRVDLSEDGPEPAAKDGEHSELRWLRAAELDDLDWLPADRELIPILRSLLSAPPS